jgi:hypothetical protein
MPDDDQHWARGPAHNARTRGPVMDAYAETDALTRPCPHCGANVDEFCVHESGVQRKIPCPQRLPHNPDPGAEQ